MKRKLYMFLFIVTISIGSIYFGFVHYSGAALPTFGLPLGGEYGTIRNTISKFWEDIQFKNTKHILNVLPEEDQDFENINYFLVRIFGIDTRELDIQKYNIEKIEIDSSKMKARAQVRVLANGIDDLTIMLFFYKNIKNKNKWLLELRNSF